MLVGGGIGISQEMGALNQFAFHKASALQSRGRSEQRARVESTTALTAAHEGSLFALLATRSNTIGERCAQLRCCTINLSHIQLLDCCEI